MSLIESILNKFVETMYGSYRKRKYQIEDEPDYYHYDQEVEPEPDTEAYPSDIPLHFNAPPGEYDKRPERITRDGNKK